MLVIHNFGRFWRQDKIFWGAGRKKGHLKGYEKRKKTSIVDFRDQIGIYVLFDALRVPIYVGQAGIGNARLFNRLKDHRKNHLRDRWVYFSWFGLRGKNPTGDTLSGHHAPDSWAPRRTRKDALHETEAVLMSVVEAPMNKRGPNWKDSKEFIQYVDERVPKDTREIIEDLPKRIEKLELALKRMKE